MKRLYFLVSGLVLFMSGPLYANPDLKKLSGALVSVTIETKKAQHSQLGVVIGKEMVLTNTRPSAKQYLVKGLASSAKLVAKPIVLGDDYPLLLLKVEGLLNEAIVIQKEVTRGKIIYAVEPNKKAAEKIALVRGTISDLIEYQPIKKGILKKKNFGPKLNLAIHNALNSNNGHGSALVNECGELVAALIPEPWESKEVTSQRASIQSNQILKWLGSSKVGFTLAKSSCVETQARVVAAEEKIKKAEAELKKAQEKAKRSNSKAKVDKEAANKEAEEAKAKLDELQKVLDEAKQDADAERRSLLEQFKFYAMGALALMLLMFLIWMIQVRSKKKALADSNLRALNAEQAAAYAKQQSTSVQAEVANFDCILHGVDDQDKKHMIKIHKGVLAEPGGVILGRNPRNSKFIISHEEIGREHACFTYESGTLFVEDMNSTNGTFVNGALLAPKQKTTLINGSQLQLGPIKFSVELV